MSSELIYGAPAENFEGAIYEVYIPELGEPERGKVRDCWTNEGVHIQVVTDRLSCFNRVVGAVPGKGRALNLTSNFQHRISGVRTSFVDSPHPNVCIAEKAEVTLPVEVVLRRHMAKSSSNTSIYHNYVDLGKRSIYGIDFPDGLQANQEFPMGTVITPTTKAEKGQHDQMLTDEEAEELVDKKVGKGTWSEVKKLSLWCFNGKYTFLRGLGLIVADTKLEWGIDRVGDPMLIDELLTPDSSRFWKLETYLARLQEGLDPENYDKEVARNWLAKRGFTGKDREAVPVIDRSVIEEMNRAYRVPYQIVTGELLPQGKTDPEEIRNAVVKYLDYLTSLPS